MQNIDVHNTEINPSIHQLFIAARQEGRRDHAYLMAMQLENWALDISRRRLGSSEAAELLRNAAEILLNQAQDVD
ncbi:DUF2732 family protein [Sodalis sp.]|uniref:DUF2732 family protein n=1 Tax=Sodalis sp. (in: enterobacteria) TaxID=1898979 RepID=UPI003873A659